MPAPSLTEYPSRVRYSLLEYQLFAMLPKTGARIGVRALIRKRLKEGPWNATYPRNVLNIVMQRLIRKVAANREPFRIRRTKGVSGTEAQYWIEPLTSRSSHAGGTRISVLD